MNQLKLYSNFENFVSNPDPQLQEDGDLSLPGTKVPLVFSNLISTSRPFLQRSKEHGLTVVAHPPGVQEM